MKPRKKDEEKEKIVERLVIMDDAIFEAMCQSPRLCGRTVTSGIK